MGCDIHFYVETRRTPTSPWRLTTPLDERRRRLIESRPAWKAMPTKERIAAANAVIALEDKNAIDSGSGQEYGHGGSYEIRRGNEQFYFGRNYYLFSKLANVRSYRGSDITPMGDPKGVPEDASLGYRRLVRRYGDDGHSHSYWLLSELETQDWELTQSGSFAVAIKALQALGLPSDQVRAVFYFDN